MASLFKFAFSQGSHRNATATAEPAPVVELARFAATPKRAEPQPPPPAPVDDAQLHEFLLKHFLTTEPAATAAPEAICSSAQSPRLEPAPTPRIPSCARICPRLPLNQCRKCRFDSQPAPPIAPEPKQITRPNLPPSRNQNLNQSPTPSPSRTSTKAKRSSPTRS